ncbi:gp13 [Sphingomonas phage PAU]|uniref:gp13 n=1 Tax=Sphingomonas phage PAU TaxID=1150991 RepID=UPI0002573112|nr:gp13 [Sphingomonas phage PAU]AFF28011.1 gp13 [Sphingomonas phage PAU]
MENFLNELLGLILNGVTPAQYVASFLFATFGGITSLILGTSKRKVDETNPEKFSRSFLILNNLQRIVSSIIITFIMIRMSNIAFDPNVTIGLAFFFGYSSDTAMKYLRNLESKSKDVEKLRNHFLGR